MMISFDVDKSPEAKHSEMQNPNTDSVTSCVTPELTENASAEEDTVDTENDSQINFQTDSVNNELPNETLTGEENDVGETDDAPENTTQDSALNVLSNENLAIHDNTRKTKVDHRIERISQFPLGRIKDIMKSDPDVNIVSAECVFLLAKATEMFLQKLAKEIHIITLRNKKKTLQKRDLDSAIAENPIFEFLEGVLD